MIGRGTIIIMSLRSAEKIPIIDRFNVVTPFALAMTLLPLGLLFSQSRISNCLQVSAIRVANQSDGVRGTTIGE